MTVGREYTLKPCPFCKKQNARIEKTEVGKAKVAFWQVNCVLCDARGPLAERESEAVAYWNREMVP